MIKKKKVTEEREKELIRRVRRLSSEAHECYHKLSFEQFKKIFNKSGGQKNNRLRLRSRLFSKMWGI